MLHSNHIPQNATRRHVERSVNVITRAFGKLLCLFSGSFRLQDVVNDEAFAETENHQMMRLLGSCVFMDLVPVSSLFLSEFGFDALVVLPHGHALPNKDLAEHLETTQFCACYNS